MNPAAVSTFCRHRDWPLFIACHVDYKYIGWIPRIEAPQSQFLRFDSHTGEQHLVRHKFGTKTPSDLFKWQVTCKAFYENENCELPHQLPPRVCKEGQSGQRLASHPQTAAVSQSRKLRDWSKRTTDFCKYCKVVNPSGVDIIPCTFFYFPH